MVFLLVLQTFFQQTLISSFFIIINKDFIDFIFIDKTYFVQQSLAVYKDLQKQLFVQKMLFDQFQHSFSVDQEQKILKEIQDINKKLNSNPHSGKHIVSQKSLRSQKNDSKYFSQQCDELFNDNNYQNILKIQQSYNDSLFSNKNSMLLENYQKEIRNFKEYQSDKFSSLNQNRFLFNKQQKKPIKSEQNLVPNNYALKEQNSFHSKKSIEKNTSHSNNNKLQQNKSKSRIKSIAESKIKKYIENKQNISPAANLQAKGKSFIKEVKKKIKFQTQPDCQKFYQQDSLETQKNDHVFNLVNNIRKTRGKLQTSSNSLQCTFKPNILKKSSEIAQNLQPSFQRLTQDILVSKSQSKLPYKARNQLTSKKYSAKRLEQLSQPRKLKTLAEDQQPKYDFRPSLSKKSLQQMANCTMDVASRNKLWLQQKQAKIIKLKVEEQQKKFKQQNASYVPKITPYKGEKQVHLSRYTKQGISSYFERVSMAKQKNQTIQKKKPVPKEQAKQINVVMKKKTYDDAVKQLHKRIMTMNL